MHLTRLTLATLSFVASAGVALLAGTATIAAAAPAGSAVSWGTSRPAFDPCPCDNPICRPACRVS